MKTGETTTEAKAIKNTVFFMAECSDNIDELATLLLNQFDARHFRIFSGLVRYVSTTVVILFVVYRIRGAGQPNVFYFLQKFF